VRLCNLIFITPSSGHAGRRSANGKPHPAEPITNEGVWGFGCYASLELQMGEYLDLLLTSLARLEAHTDNRGVIEVNIARVNIGAMLGEAWVEKYVLPSLHPDPWMLNGNDEWFKAHPVDGRDIRRGLHFYRVVRFSDALFTVGLGRINGFDVLRKRLRERTDMRALFAELEIASLLVKNKATVKVIGESGTRGQDFDLLVTVRGVPVSVEITAIATDAVMSARL
jgi:hypothetical protein